MRYLVIGAAGHAQEVAWSLHEQTAAVGEVCELLFFDDHKPLGPVPSGLGEVAGDLERAGNYACEGQTQLVLGIGLPRIKASVVSRLSGLTLPWKTVVHPNATIGPNVEIGRGSYVAAGAIVTVNVRIGAFVTVNMHCQVAHETKLGDFATLHPDVHLSGAVTIGDGCELGTGAIVVPGLSIGPWAVLGAGCAATKSLPGGRTYAGLPAREIASGRSTDPRVAGSMERKVG